MIKLRCEITKQTTEMVDVKKKKEVEMSEEEYAEAVAKAQEEAKKKAQEARKKELEKKKAEEAAAAEEEVQAAEDPAADQVMEDVEVPEVTVSKMKTIPVTEQQEKKIFKKIEVPVEFTSYMEMTSAEMQGVKAQEKKMSDFDA